MENINNASASAPGLERLPQTEPGIETEPDETEPDETDVADLPKDRETERKLRVEREVAIVNSLTAEELQAIETVLRVLQDKKSTWLVNLFKYVSSVCSEELANHYDGIERSFEIRGNAVSEIWKDKFTKQKIYESINKFLPADFKKWLINFGERRKALKAG